MSDPIDNMVTNENVPSCADCGTTLTVYKDENPQFSGFGFGCPECCEPYCPFCFTKLNDPPHCEHLIADLNSEETSLEASPFNETELDAALGKFVAKYSEFPEGSDWSEGQKEMAFGTLMPSYQTFETYQTFEEGENQCDALIAFLESLPPVSGINKVSYMWESPSPGYFYAKGFFCDKPEVTHSYYKEQAAKFVDGLNALAEMEPEGTTVS